METIAPNKRKETIINKARRTINMNREIAMNILDFDDLDHNNHLYECGNKFLGNLLTENSVSSNSILRDKSFWNWYRSEWSICQDKWIAIYMSLKNFDLTRARSSYELFMFNNCVESDDLLSSFDQFLKVMTK